MPVITNAGEYLITQQQQAGEPLIIDQMILANITGLDSNTVPSREQSMPAPADVKIIKPITKDGLLNTNTVVYSTVFTSTDGTFDFNYMGLYSSAHDVIVAVAYVPLQTKIKTVGTDVGNVITKNFAIEFNAAADITGINISAESWQIDYTARLLSMDKNQRDLIKNIYGPSTFLNDAFKVKFEADKYYLTAGKAILGGINFDLEADLEIVPGALPQTVWLDVYQETSMMGVLNKHDVVINDGTVLTDYVAGSVEHTLVKLGVVNSSVDIVDARSLVKRSLELTTKNNDPKNVAELRKYRPEYAGQKLDIDGHTLPGLGGGPFYHDPDDSTSPDDNGLIIVTEWGDRWKRKDIAEMNPYIIGAVDLLTTDQSAYINAAFNAAKTLGVGCNLMGQELRINNTVLFRDGVVVRGNGCKFLNYSGTDACKPHPDDVNVTSEVSGITVTFENYKSNSNNESPPYTVDKTKKLGRQQIYTHLSTFTGNGWGYSNASNGGGFKNLVNCKSLFHKVNFWVLGPSPRLRNCAGLYGGEGIRGEAVPEEGIFNPPHSAVIDGCIFNGNDTNGQTWRYVDGLRINGGANEKNFQTDVFLEGCRGATGSIYAEYGINGVTMFLCEGIEFDVYGGGNKAAFVPFAQDAGAYYTETLEGGSNTITVAGITGFSSISAGDIAIVRNSKYYQSWSKSGNDITLTGSYSDGDIIEVIAYAYLDPSVNKTAIHDKYELGSEFPLKIQHSQDIVINGYVGNYIDGTANINDFDPGNLPISANIIFNARFEGTPRSTSSKIFYKWQEGFLNKPKFFEGIEIKNSTDSNVGVSTTGKQHYPPLGASTISLGADAHSAMWTIISTDGCVVFTIDKAGNIYTGSNNNQVLSVKNVNDSVDGKINIYKAGANQLSIDNKAYPSSLTFLRVGI